MSEKLEAWILKNAEKIELKLIELTWIKDFFPNKKDLAATFKIDSREWTGHGCADSKDMALKKAVVEAVERQVAIANGFSSNGVAAHTDLEQAKKNAQDELIERDLFLSHFLTRTPFINNSEMLSIIPPHLLEYIHGNNDEMQLFKFKKNNMGVGHLCLIRPKEIGGAIIGLSFGAFGNDQELILKAVIETFRQYRFEIGSNHFKDVITLDQFLKLSKWTFSDHGNLSLEKNYFSQISFLFPDKNEEVNDKLSVIYNQEQFEFLFLESQFQRSSDCPLYILKCKGKNIQELYLGPYNENQTSHIGLERFLHKKISTINQLPHPLR